MPRTNKAKTTIKRNATNTVKAVTKEVKTLKNIKIADNIKDINNFAVETANMIVDESFETAAEWQTIVDKAIKNGFQIASKNQDLVFSALESVKGSLVNGTKKFSEIFSKN